MNDAMDGHATHGDATPAADRSNAAPGGDTRLELVLTSEASQERAEMLAQTLLQRRLVACATLLPGRSLYQWRGRIEHETEVLLLLKTGADRLAALHHALLELHSYETPEWIHWSAASAGGYAAWLAEQLSPDAASPAPAATPGDGGPTG
jgi:periplasmic divalent cation tolerance protein